MTEVCDISKDPSRMKSDKLLQALLSKLLIVPEYDTNKINLTYSFFQHLLGSLKKSVLGDNLSHHKIMTFEP